MPARKNFSKLCVRQMRLHAARSFEPRLENRRKQQYGFRNVYQEAVATPSLRR